MSERLARVNAVMDEYSRAEFRYGEHDCFTFTCAMVQAWHGRDFWRHRRHYVGPISAARYVRVCGGLARMVTDELGPPIRSPLDARSGDVVIGVVGPGRVALGFVVNNFALFVAERGVCGVPLSACSLAWRIS